MAPCRIPSRRGRHSGIPHCRWRYPILVSSSWIAKPKAASVRRRTLFLYEKGLIWGLKNYENVASVVDLALLTGNLGKPGTGCGRLGGHQEGYSRPNYPGKRPPVNVDEIAIKGGVQRSFGWQVATLQGERSMPSNFACPWPSERPW